MLKVLTVFGTRPEAIKLAPVLQEFKRHPELVSRVCVTAQHREMLDPFLKIFDIHPDYDLDIMQPNQTLFDITIRALDGLKRVLEAEQPDFLLVQGDTTSAFAAALAAFYLKIPIGHVEAGLRTFDKYHPYPEEINRRLISHLADLHFTPTLRAQANLLAEGIPPNKIFVTGNTVVDAILLILERTKDLNLLPPGLSKLSSNRKLILVTAHRRESFGQGLESICLALRRIVEEAPDVEIVYPLHMNPNVRTVVTKVLKGVERVHLLEPMDYVAFVHLMARSYLILTDSGGIQEEAPTLKKPVLVLRETTERPEVLEVGAAKLVGTDPQKIVKETLRLLRDFKEYERMACAGNPFGDGRAAQRIAEILLKILAH
ncbi:MAG: UDP-N-acetylglucosamine 2-epimerase (non-hydrolyzing) [Candidatus Jordarchaeales archaeon]